MKSDNTYIGDEKFAKLLEHYKCPIPLSVIKMRFIGSICSPNMDLRPTDVISSLWPQGSEPRLETKEEADLFFKFFMGLWDEMFELVAQNNVLLPKHKLDKNFCTLRFGEVELGFVEGFWGGLQDLKISAFVAEIIDSLSELSSLYNSLEKKLDKASDIEEIKNALLSNDRMVEKAISFVIENSVLPRISGIKRVVN